MVLVEEERSIEEGLLELSNQSDASGCRITACVILSTFVAVCGSFSFGVAFSAFASLSTLGATFGALFSGKMAILLGRRGTMWVSDILCVIGWLCIAFAKLLQNSGVAMVFFWGNFISWRKMALLGALPCVIQGIGLFFVPESPRWLVVLKTKLFQLKAKVGADEELEYSLLRL
ncbi:hypothetical protein IGI04_008319 [Brassica rapa subsp. trilocularis]|uniref:Major facilitator superfamily (MFS) profile domain-containing protein n=1 Tax=Brassica rapa subsp. trilocularis TaxID=1813537 RepID=A0ABQ7NPK4_BRACM|nr:hypothetical protein IGI04_008319 [Brassica rapa subsp. trilocularis]